MTAERELSKALEQACRAAVLLTGIAKAAEFAVLSGIAALERGDIADNVVRVETAAAAIQWRAKLPTQSAPALVQHPTGVSVAFSVCPDLPQLRHVASFGEKPCAGLQNCNSSMLKAQRGGILVGCKVCRIVANEENNCSKRRLR
jgi:hypothetical protein